jgi:hypothetical protein
LTKPIRYSLIIFIAGFIVFSIIQGLTSHDESVVVLDKDYMNQLNADMTIKRLGGLVLVLCCLTATSLTGYSLTKKTSTALYFLFGLQLVISILIIYIFFLALTSFLI